MLARVGDRVITLGEFQDRLEAQSPYLRQRFSSPERKREMLDTMIRFELLVQEARRLGLDRDPSMARLEMQALVDELLRTEVDAKVHLEDITDAEVRADYDAHPEAWNQPEQVRASHIRVADRALAERLLAQLTAAPADVELFRRLAREHSNDAATKNAGGDLRFFGRPEQGVRAVGGPPVPVVEAAFALTEVGALAPRVVSSEDGFHVVRLGARRQAMARSFEEVRRTIQDRLFRERRAAAIDALVALLRQEGQVREDAAALADIQIDVPEATP